MATLWITVLIAMFVVSTFAATVFDHGVKLPTTRPLNIAHRGSSGTHPEHTVAAYEQAIRDGADVIECDVYVTRDLELVCLHDAFLSGHTNVRKLPEFGRKKRTLVFPDSNEVYDWFCFDFTLEELKTLTVVQGMDFRDPSFNELYNISTFDEYVKVAKSADRPIGIYPELKRPEFVNAQRFMKGNRIEDLLLASLEKHGYSKKDDACFIQSFSSDSLEYVKQKTELPLVMLAWKEEQIFGPGLNEPSRLEEWGRQFYGLGLWKPLVANHYTYREKYKNWIAGDSGLVKQAHEAGLKVHVYTFRNEDVYLAWDFAQDPYEEYDFYNQLNIDGYFTDFPKTFDRYLRAAYREVSEPEVACLSGAPYLQSNFVLSMLMILSWLLRIFK